MVISDERLKPEANNLTLVRLVLASAVIWTHSYWLISGVSGKDELSGLLGTPISAYAVDGFFFLSGFLVYGSLIRRGSVLSFARSRFLRLWPGLAVSIILTIVVGAFFTKASFQDYLGGETLRFALTNISLLTSSYTLTGVECSGELCNINGSLWTIAWEVRCYAFLALLGWLGLAKPAIMARLILPLTLVFALGYHIPFIAPLLKSAVGSGLSYYMEQADRLWTMFALGIAAYIFREKLRLSWWVCCGLLVANIAAQYFSIKLHFESIFIGYATLCAGFLSARNNSISGTWPDYSYGMYIYAFPVMIGLSALVSFEHHAALALANALVTLPLAALSWHFIEKPSLNAHRLMTARI